MDARADAALPGPAEYTLETGAPSVSESTPIGVSEGGSGVEINTGAAKFRLAAGGTFPFAAIERAGAPVLASEKTGLWIADRSGSERAATISSVHVEERGPLRTVVLIKGVASAGGPDPLLLTARLHFFAGLSTVRLLITLTNPRNAVHAGGFWDLGDPGSIFIKNAHLVVDLPSAAQSVAVSPEVNVPSRTAEFPFELYQDSSGGEHWQSTNHINRDFDTPGPYDRATGKTTPNFYQMFPVLPSIGLVMNFGTPHLRTP